jgi:hypothetical protein
LSGEVNEEYRMLPTLENLNAKMEKENKEYEEMLNYINTSEMDNKYLKKQLVDPSSALILV